MIGISSSAASGGFPSTIARSWSSTITSSCPSRRSPRPSACLPGRSDPDCVMRCVGCVRHSTPMRDRRRRRQPNEGRTRRHPHRSHLAPDGVTSLPDHVLDRVLDQVPAIRQERSGLAALRNQSMRTPLKVALAAAAIIVVTVAGLSLMPRNGTGVGGPVSPEPKASSLGFADSGSHDHATLRDGHTAIHRCAASGMGDLHRYPRPARVLSYPRDNSADSGDVGLLLRSDHDLCGSL